MTRGRARTGSWRLTRMQWRASRGTLAIWLSIDQGARGVDRGRDDHPLAVRRLGGIDADLPRSDRHAARWQRARARGRGRARAYALWGAALAPGAGSPGIGWPRRLGSLGGGRPGDTVRS